MEEVKETTVETTETTPGADQTQTTNIETTPTETPKETEPVKTEETPKEPEAPKNDEELQTLKNEIEKLKGQLGAKDTLEQTIKTLQGELEQLKGNTETTNSKVAEYEAVINDVLNSKLESIPEKFRDLVPQNLSVKEQLAWITKAESNGLFGQGAQGEVEIGKPLNPKSPTQQIDMTKLSPGSILSMAYGSKK